MTAMFGVKRSGVDAMHATTADKTLAGLLGHLVGDDNEFTGQFLRALDVVISGGADIGECFVTAQQITPGDHDGWRSAWRTTADRVFAAAEASEAAGHRVSAREAYLRAVTYYRTSGVFLYRAPLDPRFSDSIRRQQEAFRRAAALSEWQIETVEIPYENTTLPGYFMAPAGAEGRPTLIITNGYDGTIEELYFSGGLAALKRGYACLVFDGPGQGGALVDQGLVFRPDWEAVVTPVVDWLIERPEVDPARIALMGRSFGGYLAPRAASGEHRLAAMIADAAQYSFTNRRLLFLPEEYRDQADTGDPAVLNPLLEAAMAANPYVAFSVERGMLTHGVDTPIDYLRAMRTYTNEGYAERITCPCLICEAENDVRGGDAAPLYDAITAPKTYLLFTNEEGAGEHDEAGAAGLFSQRVFDWLDEILAGVGT
jgi:hypothetical protein